MLKVKVKGLRELQKSLGAQGKKQKKALETAIKVEGFKQLRQLRDDLKKGRPGGRPYTDPLSKIARRTKTGRMKKNQIPLYKLARLLRYNVSYTGGKLNMAFGFVHTHNRKLSGSWKKLLLKHEEGIDVLYSGSRTELGEELANIGGKLKKRGDPDAKFFFLKKTTGRRVKIPERSMIDAHWDTHKRQARRNIAANFARKMRGERI